MNINSNINIYKNNNIYDKSSQKNKSINETIDSKFQNQQNSFSSLNLTTKIDQMKEKYLSSKDSSITKINKEQLNMDLVANIIADELLI
jgi:hypothetical protein